MGLRLSPKNSSRSTFYEDNKLIDDILNDCFLQVEDFSISDEKVILWSKVQILYASLDNIRNENTQITDLELTKSDFEIT